MFLSPSLFRVKILENKGKGVFSKRSIEAGAVIGDYLGTVIDNKSINEKEQGLYDMWYSDFASVLADPNEIGVHLFNHSCSPNCSTYTYKDRTLFFYNKIYIFK